MEADRTKSIAKNSLHQLILMKGVLFSLPWIFVSLWARLQYELAIGRYLLPSNVLDYGFVLWRLALLLLAFVSARSLGMAANRLLDRHLDAKNPRTQHRALCTGEVSLSVAYGLLSLSFLLYLLASFALGGLFLKLSPILAFLIVFYSLTKRFTVLCHFFLSLVQASASLLAFYAAIDSYHLPGDLPLDLHLGAFAWALASFLNVASADIIYSSSDVDFDRHEGLRSIPSYIGVKRALIFARVLLLGSIVSILVAITLWQKPFFAAIAPQMSRSLLASYLMFGSHLLLLLLYASFLPFFQLVLFRFPFSRYDGFFRDADPSFYESWFLKLQLRASFGAGVLFAQMLAIFTLLNYL